jgi:hypothetical protein
MGNCTVFHDELRFDVRDPEVTHVYCFIRGEGDCPFMVHGWHHKAFPKAFTTQELFNMIWAGQESPITWEREAPVPMLEEPLFSPEGFVPVLAKELVQWQASVAEDDQLTKSELSDAITARLTSVPEWDKACPHCRAHAAMMQAQMAPRE